MISKRTNLLAGSLLGGALLLGTAGLALAQDPTPTTTTTPGGMMADESMMDSQGMSAMHAGMMNGQGTQDMNAGQMRGMAAMHAGMLKSR